MAESPEKKMAMMVDGAQPHCDEPLQSVMTCSHAGTTKNLFLGKLQGFGGGPTRTSELPRSLLIAVGPKTVTLGPKVRVNCIAPGPFLTDISKAWDIDAFNETAKTSLALGRGGEPHEIVGAALYLASDASSYTTGTVIDVNGGPR
jgi:hypothetical protein